MNAKDLAALRKTDKAAWHQLESSPVEVLHLLVQAKQRALHVVSEPPSAA
jgi:hypothetical protein